MLDWRQPLEHKKTIKINLLITAPDRKAKTMDEVSESMWAAEDEIKEKLVEINEKYVHLNFELDTPERFGYPTKGRENLSQKKVEGD
jgi:hypothetical protein